jgi:L-alanine-DL-glutamate epimerase-like enolase superfamily enzyme
MPQLVLVSVSTHEGIDGHYISYLIPTPTVPHAAEVAKAILIGRDTYDVGALSREMTSVLPSYQNVLSTGMTTDDLPTVNDRGYIPTPQKPGLGYEIDRDAVDNLTLQRF